MPAPTQKMRLRRATPDELARYFQQSARTSRVQPRGYGVGDPNTTPQGPGYQYSEDNVFDPTVGTPMANAVWKNNRSGTTTPFTVADTSTQIVPANGNRVLLIIQNFSTTDTLYFNFGQAASALNGIALAVGAGIILDFACPNDSVNVFFNTVTPQNGNLLEVVDRG